MKRISVSRYFKLPASIYTEYQKKKEENKNLRGQSFSVHIFSTFNQSACGIITRSSSVFKCTVHEHGNTSGQHIKCKLSCGESLPVINYAIPNVQNLTNESTINSITAYTFHSFIFIVLIHSSWFLFLHPLPIQTIKSKDKRKSTVGTYVDYHKTFTKVIQGFVIRYCDLFR